MKKIILSTLLISFSILCSAQNFVDVIKWEANTESKGKFIGISKNKQEATKTIDSLISLNKNTSNKITSTSIRFASIKSTNKEVDVFKEFYNHSASKNTKFLSHNDLISLKIIEKQGLNQAAQFYKNANNVTNIKLVEFHLKNLKKNYSKYMLKQASKSYMSYSE